MDYWTVGFGTLGNPSDSQRQGRWLSGDEASTFADRWNINFRLKPRGSHASIVERHHQVVRDMLHKMLSETRAEGVAVPYKHLLAECVLAKNI